MNNFLGFLWIALIVFTSLTSPEKVGTAIGIAIVAALYNLADEFSRRRP